MATQSNLPTIQRLKYEDYARQTNWQDAFRALVQSLNLFIPTVYTLLNGNVTYQNLTVPQLYSVTVTAATVTSFTFNNPLMIPPSAVLVGNIWSGVPSTHPASAVQVFWHVTSNQIVVDNVTGLSAGTQYVLTLVVL